MSNAIFPVLPGITWNITREPRYSTKIQQAVGGEEVAASFQPYPIWGWTLQYELLRTYGSFTEWQTLAGFFNARKGSFDTFLYDDPEDDTVTLQSIGIGDAANTTFQLLRTLGGNTEPIYNYNSTIAAPKIYLNGVLQVSGYSIGANPSGVVTFTSAPGSGVVVAWSGQYYWRCRFEQDSTQFGMFAQHFWENKKVSFRSVLGA